MQPKEMNEMIRIFAEPPMWMLTHPVVLGATIMASTNSAAGSSSATIERA